MKAYNMHWIKIDNLSQAKKVLTRIGTQKTGIDKLAGEAVTRVIKLEGVPSAEARVIKEEMLSVNGNAELNYESIRNGETDVILLGSHNQFFKLAERIRGQSENLKNAAESLDRILINLEKPQKKILKCKEQSLELGEKTILMGILNVTPDSFSDGGKYLLTEAALKQAEKLVAEGADILDIGAESTRPGHTEISAEEEWKRLEPILKELIPNCSVPISVDTQKSSVAEKALALGVQMINDIWGLQKDPRMAEVVGSSEAALVIMHNKENTEYGSMMSEIIQFLEYSVELAIKKGLKEDQIILDPGIGFGKTPEQNMEVLSRLDELKVLGMPILLGVSRKSVIGRTLNLPVAQRLEPTLALGMLGIASGADILRVHDVYEHKKAVMMADQIIRRKRGTDYEGK